MPFKQSNKNVRRVSFNYVAVTVVFIDLLISFYKSLSVFGLHNFPAVLGKQPLVLL